MGYDMGRDMGQNMNYGSNITLLTAQVCFAEELTQ